MQTFCPSHQEAFEELDQLAPGVPLLALGQTAFWDEPMKAGVALCSVALQSGREFVAGIHDTDYFAKHPGPAHLDEPFFALPHNDTSTRDLWSAAGEFSALFGSETVVTRERLQRVGVPLGKIIKARPSALDEATEAFGWRGVVFGGDSTSVISETSVGPAANALLDTLNWAIEQSLRSIPPCLLPASRAKADALRALTREALNSPGVASIADFYREVLPLIYAFVAGQSVPMRATQTSELLRFNNATAGRSRFQIVDCFLQPDSAEAARQAYNQALAGTEVYGLDRFGTFALPFDLVVPGHGRGTLRVAPRAVIIMTPTPLFITLKKPIEGILELAEAIERKFGPNCALVGKAVSLIPMLGAEHVFVFHEGASGYVKHTRKFLENLSRHVELPLIHPILRIKYETWDRIGHCKSWIKLPEPLRGPFGAEDVNTETFASRFRYVQKEQQELLDRLQELRRPIDLVRYLSEHASQSWGALAEQYEGVHHELERLDTRIRELRSKRQAALAEWREFKQERASLERAKGEHWRAFLFEQSPSSAREQERAHFSEQIRLAAANAEIALEHWRSLMEEQRALVNCPDVLNAHEKRRTLELEIELARMKMVRQAVTATDGLTRAGFRPSAWWFPLICPDGGWFRETVNTAEYYLEHLQ